VHLVQVASKETAVVVGALIREVRRLPGQLLRTTPLALDSRARGVDVRVKGSASICAHLRRSAFPFVLLLLSYPRSSASIHG
jgi:hypothetical protein